MQILFHSALRRKWVSGSWRSAYRRHVGGSPTGRYNEGRAHAAEVIYHFFQLIL
jgi:hypothetical protein